MNEAIREMFLTEWVEEATTDEIVKKLIENDERAKEIERLNNIINELEEYLIKKQNSFNICNAYDILNKLKELKENK